MAKRCDEDIRYGLKLAEYAPIVHLSALTGHRAPKLLEMVERVERSPTGKPDYRWAKQVAMGEAIGCVARINWLRLAARPTRAKPPDSSDPTATGFLR